MARKRGNGEGTMTVLKDGRIKWQVQVGFKDDGSRDVRSGRTKAKGREARTEAMSAIQVARGMPPEYNPREKLSVCADKWYAELKRRVEEHKLEESTYVGYKYALNHIKSQWGNRKVGSLTASDIETGLDKILKPDGSRYDFGYYKQMKGMLVQIYKHAEKGRIIMHDENPMPLVERLVNPEREYDKKDSWTLEETQAVLAAEPQFRGTRNYKYYCAMIVAMAIPCRSQDIIPLTISDIEPDGSVVDINKAIKIGAKAKPYMGLTKAAASDRLSYLPEYAWKFAKWLRDNARNGLILEGEVAHKCIHPGTYRAGVMRVIKKIDGVRHLNPHEAQRHTGASISVFEAELDEKIAMARTGHADPKVFRKYTHVHEKELKRAAKKVNDVVTTKPVEIEYYI